MEGSDYGSAHMPSPALVVFSQAANGLGEALRIQRPFHSQVCMVFFFNSRKFINIEKKMQKKGLFRWKVQNVVIIMFKILETKL